MLRLSNEALKRWKGFDQAIDRWLEERHQLIVQLTDFASDHDFRDNDPQLIRRLGSFRAILIDYVSAGHFEFFQKLLEEGREFNDETGIQLGAKLLQVIEPSTVKALDFDEKYEKSPGVSRLAADLSELGEALATRFIAEDQMISVLHDAHQAREAG